MYLIFCKERPLERPTIFWRTKLIPKRRSLHVTLFEWWDAPRTLHGTLFAWRGRFFSRENSENRGKTPNFGNFPRFLRKNSAFRKFSRKKSRFFAKKKGGASAKKIIISAKTKTQRASLTLFAWETHKERPGRSLRETLFETLFTEDKVPQHV